MKNRYLSLRNKWIRQKQIEISNTLSADLYATAIYDDSFHEYCFDIGDKNDHYFCITMTIPKIDGVIIPKEQNVYDFTCPDPIVPDIQAAIDIIKIFEKKLNIAVCWR